MLTCGTDVTEVREELRDLLKSLGGPFLAYSEPGAMEQTKAFFAASPGVCGASDYDLRCCMALELLDLAISTDMGDSAESIILPDHLMAHAIDQVRRLDEPHVVETLATSISSVAVDRAAGLSEFRTHLSAAGRALAADPARRCV